MVHQLMIIGGKCNDISRLDPVEFLSLEPNFKNPKEPVSGVTLPLSSDEEKLSISNDHDIDINETNEYGLQETQQLTALAVEELCIKQSVFSSIMNPNSVSAEEIAKAIRTISSNLVLLDQVLVKARAQQWARHEMDLICSNQFYWEFYLAMLDRLRTLMRASEVTASGNVSTTNVQ
ncbi:hypothetical protein ACA910_007026 [Epithemia clementina (nom. ined.)]